MSDVEQGFGECAACGYGPTWVTKIRRSAFDPRVHDPDAEFTRVCKLCLVTGVANLEMLYSPTHSANDNADVKRQINYLANAFTMRLDAIEQRIMLASMPAAAATACRTCGHSKHAHDQGAGACVTKMPGSPGGICQCEEFAS